jgi:regulator of protease activity HflC (stomatin/prohibitin superfamily)
MTILAALLVAVILYILLIEENIERVVILDHERGLLYRKGTFRGILGPGVYRIYAPSASVTRVDMRPFLVPLPDREAQSADRVTVRADVTATCRIEDPRRAVAEAADPGAALRLALELALREIVEGTEADAILERRSGIGPMLARMAAPKAERLGLKLLSVDVNRIAAGEAALPPAARQAASRGPAPNLPETDRPSGAGGAAGDGPGERAIIMPEAGEGWNRQ